MARLVGGFGTRKSQKWCSAGRLQLLKAGHTSTYLPCLLGPIRAAVRRGHHEERTPTCFSEVLLWWSWSRGTRSGNLSPSTGPSEEVDESSTSWQVHGQVLPKKCTCLSAQLWQLSCCWKKSAGHEKGCPPPHCYRLRFNFILWTKQNETERSAFS